jgi:predicted nuclease of predicted toxin-antitoxin system
MKFLIDMNLSPLWIPFLNQKGFEAIHWSEVGPPTALDTEIMEYASSREFVIFTHDLDFGRLLAMRSSGGPSVVQIRTQDVLPSAVGDVVVNALKAATRTLMPERSSRSIPHSIVSGCCRSTSRVL